MKNIIFISVISAFLFISCNSASSSSHTHEDGTVHADCDQEHEIGDGAEQEVFELEPGQDSHQHDSCASEEEHSHTHAPEEGSVHEH